MVNLTHLWIAFSISPFCLAVKGTNCSSWSRPSSLLLSYCNFFTSVSSKVAFCEKKKQNTANDISTSSKNRASSSGISNTLNNFIQQFFFGTLILKPAQLVELEFLQFIERRDQLKNEHRGSAFNGIYFVGFFYSQKCGV